jgi:hypothetical protein
MVQTSLGHVTGATFLVLALAAGCNDGPRLVKAGGVVKYKGAPLPGADVVFVPDAGGLPSIGRTDESGRFTLSTSGRPGAPPGPYKVSVTALRQKRAVPEAEAVSMTSEQIAANHETLIPVKYNNLITSGLTATVGEDAAKNDYLFDLK